MSNVRITKDILEYAEASSKNDDDEPQNNNKNEA